MALTEIFAALTAAGYRVNEAAGTVDGVTNNIAWRLIPAEGTLDMSLNISAENLARWQQALNGRGTISHHGFGVRLCADGLSALSGDDVLKFIDGWTSYAAGAAGASFEDKFESFKEPASFYWLGLLGALLGAFAGVIPWVLVSLLSGWELGILGALISVASFFGYRLLRGAHDTRFAMVVIVIASILAVFFGQTLCTAVSITLYSEAPIAFLDALAYCFSLPGIISVAGDSLFAVLMCALGFVGIRGRVLEYTHERGFLRRKK